MGLESGAEGGLATGLVAPVKGGGGGGFAPGAGGGVATGTTGGLTMAAAEGRMIDESTEVCGGAGAACFGACTF